jgi:hypothetical protein
VVFFNPQKARHEKNGHNQNPSTLFSRREFMKNSILAAGAAGALANVSTATAKAATTPSKLSLTLSETGLGSNLDY